MGQKRDCDLVYQDGKGGKYNQSLCLQAFLDRTAVSSQNQTESPKVGDLKRY